MPLTLSHQGLHPGLLGPLPSVAAKKSIEYTVRFSGSRHPTFRAFSSARSGQWLFADFVPFTAAGLR